MQIVIDINESDYKTLMINSGNCSISMAERIVKSVYEGKKLPKGHGRLIDADKIRCDDYAHMLVCYETILRVPTIIKADKEDTL